MSLSALQTTQISVGIQSGRERIRTLSRPYGIALLLLLPLIFAYFVVLAIPDSGNELWRGGKDASTGGYDTETQMRKIVDHIAKEYSGNMPL